jgi:threonine/homoserine/homoserine lactone efflux protein
MDGLLLGLSLGLGAGLAPGPLLALVIRTAAQDGLSAGVRVAFSPLITDLLIILVAVVAARSVPATVLGVLTIAGGAFVVWLGVDALREPTTSTSTSTTRRNVLWGALTNALSPHPWVFWITVGATVLATSTPTGAALFLVAFYLLLIGAKVVIAAAVAAGRDRLLEGRGYAILLRLSGVLLLTTGALLIIDGVRGSVLSV